VLRLTAARDLQTRERAPKRAKFQGAGLCARVRSVTVALALGAILVAFVFVWRGLDVRIALFVAAMTIGVLAGQPGAVFKKTAETLADGKFLLPICSAMGFAYVVRETGCVDALVRLLVAPVLRAPKLLLPGSAAVALVVNMAVPSQTSTLAAVGPFTIALLARARAAAGGAGTALVFGASVCGALLNPGVAEVVAVSQMIGRPAPAVSVPLAPGVLLAFLVGIAVLLGARRVGVGRSDTELAPLEGSKDASEPPRWKAIFPPLPVVGLLLAHPALPTSRLLLRALPAGLEVFTAMLVGAALALVFASGDRAKTTRTLFDGMGYAFTHVVTIIAVSAGTAKALEVAGVLRASVALTAGNPAATYAVAFALAFALAAISGSGTASSVALVATIGTKAAELGVSPPALGGVILFAAEAGRTTSPVAAVLLFGSTLVQVPPRTLAQRLVVPCLVAGAAGAIYCVLRVR
jgi:DcuC family C4-dicarboxylate transporter